MSTIDHRSDRANPCQCSWHVAKRAERFRNPERNHHHRSTKEQKERFEVLVARGLPLEEAACQAGISVMSAKLLWARMAS